MVEQAAVNGKVVGSSPTPGENFREFLSLSFFIFLDEFADVLDVVENQSRLA